MKKKILGIFDRRPLIWLHYVLLTLISQVSTILWFKPTTRTFLTTFIVFFLIISISDQIIHKILNVD